MIPAALALGSGGEFRSPMAVAVIGGLISSTLLSLVFVPAVFVVMDDVGRLLWRFFGRFVGAVDEPPAAPVLIQRPESLMSEPRSRPMAAE
jgi:hypothetical protein